MPQDIIKKNKAKCLHCGDILLSTPEKKVDTCTCGKLTVKGGFSFILRTGRRGVDYEELSFLDYDAVEKTYKDESETK